jgi:hypothetical protein
VKDDAVSREGGSDWRKPWSKMVGIVVHGRVVTPMIRLSNETESYFF